MAIVKSFSQEMVRDLYGVVDFYYWKKIPVARIWPRKTTIPPSSAMIGSRNAFIRSRADLKLVGGKVRTAWGFRNKGRKQAWLDYYTSVYLRMWKYYKRYPPLVTNYRIITE